MLIASSLLIFAIQVGPNPNPIPLTDGHTELRERMPREEEAFSDPSSDWLARCLAMVAEDAARAHSLAQVRLTEVSGDQRVLANHCLGLAATELGLWEDAIAAFGAARDETPAGQVRARARFGSMAGNAALASGDPMRAEAILRRAKLDAQEAASATLQALAATDLARALVGLQDPENALIELETATSLEPQFSEGWLLKATLLRRLDRLDEAQIAIERASELTPLDPQIGLEAGVIAVLSGRDEAARTSWQSVIDIQPASPSALIAQDYLAQLGPPPAISPEEEPS